MENKKGLYLASVGQKVGVFAISLVDKPANRTQFRNPCKSGLCSLTENNEVVGLILRPGQVIERLNEDGTIWAFQFDEKGVKEAHESLTKNLALKNSNLQHSDLFQEGVTFTESWLVEDIEHDKSKLFGFKPKEGEWYVKAKIENDEVLTELREGRVKGFSLEGEFEFTPLTEQKTELKSINMPEGKNSIYMNILKLFGVEKEDAEKTKLAEELETKLASVDELKESVAALAAKIEKMQPTEPSEEEMAAEAEKAKQAEEAEKMRAEKITALETELAELKAANTKLSEQVAQIPVTQETLRQELKLSEEEKAKAEHEAYLKMSVAEKIEYNRRKNSN